jgi:DNA (cytosine-5)-methyltransferase 1
MSEKYISVFSGIGGLEHPSVHPILICESDQPCQTVLRSHYPDAEIIDDICKLDSPPSADYIVGGWPCQDLSSAGTLGGIEADRSGLFFKMLEVAKKAGAHTLIGENVPNLLTINQGKDFLVVLDAFVRAEYRFVSWRVLNARAFGLAQSRRRLFIVASKNPEHALALHASVSDLSTPKSTEKAYGFYWTGGKRSICFSKGFVPTLKIGATDNNGRAPVAVFFRGLIRKLSAEEFLRLQGFSELEEFGFSKSTLLRMAGNAVPLPMGNFVVKSVFDLCRPDSIRTGFGHTSESGFLEHEMMWEMSSKAPSLCANLADFLDESGDVLSPQASAGLIVRSVRASQPMPRQLFSILLRLAESPQLKLWPSRGNSFEALDAMQEAIAKYELDLPSIDDFENDSESDEGVGQ